MPSGKTSRARKAKKRADARARAKLALNLPGGRVSIQDIMAQEKVSYSTAQTELRQEQVARAVAGESVSNATHVNGYTKARDDSLVSVSQGIVQDTKTIRTLIARNSVVAEAHKLRGDLTPGIQVLVDFLTLLRLSATLADSVMEAAELELADLKKTATP